MWMLGEIFEWVVALFTDRMQRPSSERHPRSDKRRITSAYTDAWTLRDGPNPLDETLRAQLLRHDVPASLADPSGEVGQHLYVWFRTSVRPRKMKRLLKTILF
jgi:hypothetical protein